MMVVVSSRLRLPSYISSCGADLFGAPNMYVRNSELLRGGIEKGAVVTVVHAWNHDRAAEAATKIILSIAGLGTARGVVEKRVCVESLVTDCAESGPVRLVLPRPHDEVEHAAGGAAESAERPLVCI